MMDPESACALLYKLADLHMNDGFPLPGEPPDLEERATIVALLTELLGREPNEYEIRSATYSS